MLTSWADAWAAVWRHPPAAIGNTLARGASPGAAIATVHAKVARPQVVPVAHRHLLRLPGAPCPHRMANMSTVELVIRREGLCPADTTAKSVATTDTLPVVTTDIRALTGS